MENYVSVAGESPEDLDLIIKEPTTPHTHTVVFLHGRGDHAYNFSYSLNLSKDSNDKTLYQQFPSFRWVFPQARTSDCAAWPGEKQSQWFDLWSYNNFQEREELQTEGLRESVVAVRNIMKKEADILEGKWDHLVLAGLSQGAAAGVHVLINLRIPPAARQQGKPQRLGAFLGFSNRMPFPGRILSDTRDVLKLDDVPGGDELVRNTPVLLEHCVDDPLIPIDGGRGLRDSMKIFGAEVTWREYPHGGHWFKAPEGIDDAVQFIRDHVSDIPSV